MKIKLLFLCLAVLIAGTVSAQSIGDIFKPVPKPITESFKFVPAKDGSNIGDLVPVPTTMNALRPIANVASYGIGSAGGAALTGAGLGFQHLKFDVTTEKWNAVYSINALAWYKAVLDPNQTNPNAFAYGVAVGVFNNLLLVGGAYDGKNFFGTVGVGISLNN